VRALWVRAVVASWSCSYLLIIPRRYAGVDVPLQLLMLLVSSPDKCASGGAAISVIYCCCFSRSFRRLLMLLSLAFTGGLSRPVVVVGRLRWCQGGEKKGDEGRGRLLGDGGEKGEGQAWRGAVREAAGGCLEEERRGGWRREERRGGLRLLFFLEKFIPPL
uniref:Uncharacterized protein n=1 Tax=Solanum lycopersicum TaxID=4081 RepID=A0A3Q7JV78_SOLLC